MKNVMRFVSLLSLAIVGAIFSGCYTEFAAQESYDSGSYVESDTTYDESGNVTINNNYYLDDDYRRSRFRLSFNYYYPSYHSSWIASYYYSYYDKPYWGWGHPYWYYDPWRWGCVYPVYDPWWPYYPYPHYPVFVYYPVYYSPPIYVDNTPALPKHRADGPTHGGPVMSDRSQPIAVSGGGTTAVTLPKKRDSAPEENPTTVTRPVKTREEAPWWEKNRTVNERPAGDNPKRREAENSVRSGDRQNVNPQTQNRTGSEAKPIGKRREQQQVYTLPSRGNNDRQSGGSQPERRREYRQPSYSPPSNNSPAPSYSPPSGGGGRANGSGGSSGKRRD